MTLDYADWRWRIVPDMDEQDYHDDPALGSTDVKSLTRMSLAKWKYARSHPRHVDDSTRRAFDVGSATHSKVLGGPGVRVIDATSYQSKAAREQRQEARDNGLIPLLVAEDETTSAMAQRVVEDDVAGPLFTGEGQSELSLFWRDELTSTPCKARLDRLCWPVDDDDEYAVVDLKTTTDASPESFAKAVANYGYDQQAAHYLRGVETVHGGVYAPYKIVCVEKDPPYEVAVYTFPPEWLDTACMVNDHALDLYARHAAADDWPGYTATGEKPLVMPRWHLREWQ